MVGPNWQRPTPEENAATPTHLFKIVVIGDAGSGKSCFIRRFTSDSFGESHKSTIGVDFAVKTLVTPNNEVIKLQMWDTAGQERYRSISASYFRGAHGVLLLYDITDRKSFENLAPWLAELRKSAGEDTVVLLIGTKIDEENSREITTDEALKFAHENDLKHLFETSSKNDVNIVNAVEALATEMMSRKAKRGGNAENGISPPQVESSSTPKSEENTGNNGKASDNDKLSTAETKTEAPAFDPNDPRYRVKMQSSGFVILKNENSGCGKSKCC